MAALRVFVSSTCVDLGSHREHIRALLTRMGYEPVMSDYADVLYDPRKHTHTSCIREVMHADMVVLLIGPRFGGTAVPEALGEVDVAAIAAKASSVLIENEERKYSITQLEVLKAIDLGIPLLTFVAADVHGDHHTYVKNRDRDFIDRVDFPSIQKPKTAKYVFEFISFLTHMFSNNAVLPYASFADIESGLVKQWSGLFQSLLREAREKQAEARRTDAILEQIQDLKAAVLQTIDDKTGRNIARSVLRYRQLSEFLISMRAFGPVVDVAAYVGDFEELLAEFGVVEVLLESPSRPGLSPRTVLLCEDGTLLRVRLVSRRFDRLASEWRGFSRLDRETKAAVLQGVEDAGGDRGPLVAVYHPPSEEGDVPGDDAAGRAEDGQDDFQPVSSWTDERQEVLRSMWEAGSTASQIAEHLGGVSRNSVIGKAHRLGLNARPIPSSAPPADATRAD